VIPNLSRRHRSALLSLAAVVVLAPPARAQDTVRSNELDLLLNYGYLAAFFDPGIAGYEIEGRSFRVLNVPLTFTLRDWADRGWGLRLRVAGVLGVENVDGVGDIPDASVGELALIPGIEVPVPVGERTLLRPFFDIGLAYALDDPEDLAPGSVGIATLGLRTEHIFPWRLWELGVEPRAHYSLTWEKDALRDDYGVVGVKVDGRHPLFRISDHLLTGVVYVQPGFFVEALGLSSGGRDATVDVRYQVEFGVGYNWRGDPPRIWLFSVPPVSLGYSFGDGLSGLRLRFGGDRLTHLPPETWDRP
jgi:hypothetical protein